VASACCGRSIMPPDVTFLRRLGSVGNQTQSPSASRVALVHDFLLDVRGAERVFLELCAMWPEADIFTAVYDEQGTEGRFAGRNVNSSFLQRLRPSASTFRALLPFYPAAIESFDLSGYDLVVSSSSAWAHAVICDERSVHVSYCHNPFRYAWNDRDQTLARRRNPVTRAFLRGAFRRWRQWDWIAAQRTNRYVANSMITQSRIRAYFGRESTVVYPPVDTKRFSPGPVGDHYVIVSELMAHKQIDVAIEAFNQLRLPLVIIGDGPHARRLHRLAGPTVTLAGRLSDADVAGTLQSARALIVTSVEEFGIAAVESQAAGRPVIARAVGGALETIVDGVTGRFWSGDADALAQAVLEFDEDAVDPQVLVAHAERFGIASFRRGLLNEIAAARAGLSQPLSSPRQPLASTRLVRRAARDPHR
jgi:glycosyltransferase involved in cell wall biosynthesis